jgi:hypothetical protein
MAFLCGGGMAGSSLEAARQTAESDRDPTAQAWSATFGSLYLPRSKCPARHGPRCREMIAQTAVAPPRRA